MQSYICPACGQTFQAKPNARTGKLKTCSRTCLYKAMVTPPEIRFWKKVRKTDTCWIWTGNKISKWGHGAFMVSSKPKKTMTAQRYCWELLVGPVPENMEVCHNCPGGDNASCVNPAHMFLSTHKGNMEDAAKKKRMTCPKGEKNHSAKLTTEQVFEIKRLHSQGRTQTSLGKQFGVTQTAIYYILKGQNWKHLFPKENQSGMV